MPHNLSIVCPSCGERITSSMVMHRLERGFPTIRCKACDAEISLNNGSASALEVSSIKSKVDSGSFDVFFCYNNKDKKQVHKIAKGLLARNVLPWFDEWHLRPGSVWQEEVERKIQEIPSAAIFIGPRGRGPWQNPELRGVIDQFVKRRCVVIPVVLEGRKGSPPIPMFLEQFHRVDFREKDTDPLDRLVFGITGQRVLDFL